MTIVPKWSQAGQEPALAEVLADPIIHLVMRRDGVTLAQLRGVIARARWALSVGPCRCAA
jgi:hypothetical protein